MRHQTLYYIFIGLLSISNTILSDSDTEDSDIKYLDEMEHLKPGKYFFYNKTNFPFSNYLMGSRFIE